MNLNRRTFLYLAGSLIGARACGQGVATRNIKPQSGMTSSKTPFGAQFTDVARQAGLIQPVIYGGIDRKDYILEANGCGCAFFDFDNDGWMDIFLLTGTRLEGSPHGNTNRLYRNNRDGTFSDVTEKAGLHDAGWSNAVCVGDYNNDGFEDLFCTYFGQNKLYRNNGDGTFTDVTKQSGLLDSSTRWNAGCSFIDYNRDGHLDLFVSNYVQFDFAHVPKPGADVTCNWKGLPVNCGPRGLPPGFHSLYRNNGDGTFTDISREAGISGLRENYGMTVVSADFDEDGWPDLFVACDSTPSLMLMNNHDGTFREEGVLRGVSLSDDGSEQAGMGVGVGDFDLDGHLDLFATHFTNDTAGLYRNDGKGNFEDVTLAARIGVETRFTCWGAGIVDLDNDGFPELFMATGSVYPEVEAKLPEFRYKTPRVVFRNAGHNLFEEIIDQAGPGIAAAHSSRGCAFGDFDNDGDLDILIVNMNEPPSLLRNDLQGHQNWLKVKLVGTTSNRSAIGARVVVRYGTRKQAQSVMSQSSYYSANDPRLHFGLGSERIADVDIYWPNGSKEQLKSVSANRLITIKEGHGVVPNVGWANL